MRGFLFAVLVVVVSANVLEINEFFDSLRSSYFQENIKIDNIRKGLDAYKLLYPKHEMEYNKQRVIFKFFSNENPEILDFQHTISKQKCDRLPEYGSKVQFTNFCLLTQKFV